MVQPPLFAAGDVPGQGPQGGDMRSLPLTAELGRFTRVVKGEEVEGSQAFLVCRLYKVHAWFPQLLRAVQLVRVSTVLAYTAEAPKLEAQTDHVIASPSPCLSSTCICVWGRLGLRASTFLRL